VGEEGAIWAWTENATLVVKKEKKKKKKKKRKKKGATGWVQGGL
jgi:hypothetical protein